MNDTTKQVLESLAESEWFAHVGMHDFEPTTQCSILSSWDEALASATGELSSKLRYDAVQIYKLQVFGLLPILDDMWYGMLEELRAVTDPLVAAKAAKVLREVTRPADLTTILQWDMLHIAVEAECFDRHPGGWYRYALYIYTKGHFPCGWTATPPEGMAIIY